MRCQNPVKRWEIWKAIPDTLLFLSLSQFSSQTRKPRIPDEEFQCDTPWSPKPRKFKKRRQISNVGWSQELTEVLTATHVARLQFDSCAEKDSLCGTVMIHDGLNLRCLDQCHGVRSHGTSSSQGWRRRIVVQSKFDPWVYILVFAEGDLCRFAWESLPTEACLCRHQCFSVVAQATAKIRPRPAQEKTS